MRTTKKMSITLPNDMVALIKTKVRSGEYASESEVIRDGIRALMAQDRAIDNWMDIQVGAAYDALGADPTQTVTPEQVRIELAAKRAK